MTPDQIAYYKDVCDINYHILNYLDVSRVKVIISWTNFGILDTTSDISHIVTIKKEGTTLPLYPVTLSSTQAYNNKYKIIEELDLSKTHTINVTLTDGVDVVSKDFSTSILKAHVAVIESTTVDIVETSVNISNANDGVLIKINSCNPIFKQKVKNVTIERMVGVNPMELKYQSSVEVPYTISTDFTDYPYLNIAGKEQSSTLLDLTNLFLDRTEFVGLIEYLDDYTSYFPDTYTDISTFPSDRIITVGSQILLNPLIHNDYGSLYYSTLDDTYFRYRPKTTLVPYQFSRTGLSKFTKYAKLSYLGDSMGSISVPIDGTVSPNGNVKILGAFKASNGDFTSYSSDIIITPPLGSYLPAGVEFMNEFMSHIDKDVILGQVYTYKVTIYLYDGSSMILSLSSIRREDTAKSDGVVPLGLSLESLSTPIRGEAALTEDDFQSGVSHSGCKVFLSNSVSDYNDYVNYKKLEEDCRCRPQ